MALPLLWPARLRAAARRAGPVPFFLFAFALLVRGLYLHHIQEIPYFDFIPHVFDQHNFYAGAKAFAQGDLWAPSGNEMYSALYKYALGVVWWAAGGGSPDADEYPIFLVARGTHLLFGALASLILYVEASRYFSRRVGVISSLLYTLCGPILFHEALLSREFPAAWLSLATFAALGRLARAPTGGNLCLAALLLSLTYQCRTNAILFVPVAVYFSYRWALASFPPAKRWAWIGAAGILFAALCLPLAWRNSRRLPITNPPPPGTTRNAFTVSVQGPFEIALGNHPDCTVPGYRPVPETFDFMVKGPLTLTEAARRIWRWFLSDPVEFGRLYLRKIYWFFSDYEVPDNHSFYTWRVYSPLLNLPTSHAALYGALAIVGAAAAWRDRRRLALLYLFALASALSVVLTYVCSRFRLQAIPFWIPFAAFALERFWETLRQRALARALLLAGSVAGLTALFWLPEPDWILRALAITERHAPEAPTGEVLAAPPEPREAREIPYQTMGSNRTQDLLNLVETYQHRLGQIGENARDPDKRTLLFLQNAEEACKRLWRYADTLHIPAPFADALTFVYAHQWNDAVRSESLEQMIRIGDKWLRLNPTQAPLRDQVASLRYRSLVQDSSMDRAAFDQTFSALLAAAFWASESGDAWTALADLALRAGDLPAARFFAERLQMRAPAHPAIPQLLPHIPERSPEELDPVARRQAQRLSKEGDQLAARKDVDGALAKYAEGLRLAYESSHLRHKRASLLTRAHRDRGRARRDYEILLLVDPADAEAHIQFALCIRDEDPLRAVAHLKRALELAPHHPLQRDIQRGIQNWPRKFRLE